MKPIALAAIVAAVLHFGKPGAIMKILRHIGGHNR